MRLIEVKLSGYGRFANANLYANGKMTALIGANESGKTTILSSLLEMNSKGTWLKPYMLPLNLKDDAEIISLKFALDDSEISILAGFEVIPKYIFFIKRVNGVIDLEFSDHPIKDANADLNLADLVEKIVKNARKADVEIVDDSIFDELLEYLRRDGIASAEYIDKMLTAILLSDLDEDEKVRFKKKITEVITSHHKEIVNIEQIIEKFKNETIRRKPQFALYSDDARDIPSRVVITESTQMVKLKYLFATGGTNEKEILDQFKHDPSIINSKLGKISKLINKKLISLWSQSEIEIELIGEQSGYLNININDSIVDESQPMERRSEGLKQFIALGTFLLSLNSTSKPIILIDELEQHLHIQAQGELINFFEEQEAVSQIIYSTHSAGALPQDLNNVRGIISNSNGTSTIKNRPWQETENQVATLFKLLGAGASVFAALRAAVVTEGVVDAMLYPSIIREAMGLPNSAQIGFQCIPGLSKNNSHANYVEQSVNLLYLLDGDEGGKILEKLLLEQEVLQEQILLLQEGLAIEDYLSDEVLTKSVNKYLKSEKLDDLMTGDVLAEQHSKVKAISAFFKSKGHGKFDKKRVAAEILEIERNGEEILDPKRIGYLQELYLKISQRLHL